jgi:hypothetical protein
MFYMLQTMLFIPAVIALHAPILFMTWAVRNRLRCEADEAKSDFGLILMASFAYEI